AVEEMFERTDHAGGHWHIVPGDSKKYARIFVLETTIEETERGMRERGVEPVDVEALWDEAG
ncbi:MAG: Polyphosphate kinase 2, partial [Thermoleophilaceae bacterium]|nr:Polyphosphate kinase 2 [Thermoleophilaceae bacterium]